MSDYEVFDHLRKQKIARRAKRLDKTSDFGWSKHTDHHWYRFIDGEKLHYWPAANKWLFKGKYYRGALPQVLLTRVEQDNQYLRDVNTTTFGDIE